MAIFPPVFLGFPRTPQNTGTMVLDIYRLIRPNSVIGFSIIARASTNKGTILEFGGPVLSVQLFSNQMTRQDLRCYLEHYESTGRWFDWDLPLVLNLLGANTKCVHSMAYDRRDHTVTIVELLPPDSVYSERAVVPCERSAYLLEQAQATLWAEQHGL